MTQNKRVVQFLGHFVTANDDGSIPIGSRIVGECLANGQVAISQKLLRSLLSPRVRDQRSNSWDMELPWFDDDKL